MGSTNSFQRKPGGVFITPRTIAQIPAGGLRISLNPEIESEFELQVVFDVYPTWLDIAFRQVLEARMARRELLTAWAMPHDEQVCAALEHEFQAAMQAMTARSNRAGCLLRLRKGADRDSTGNEGCVAEE